MLIIGQDQKEYMRREFGAEFVGNLDDNRFSINEFIAAGIKPVIQVGTQFYEFDFLESLPNNSIIVHLFADEIYSPVINRKIIRMNSVAGIIRSYPLYRFSISKIVKSLIFTWDDIDSADFLKDFIPVSKQFLAGLIMVKRQIAILLSENIYRKKSCLIPLGYTDHFAHSFLRKEELSNNDSTQSLIMCKIQTDTSGSKPYLFVFLGQRGQILRELAINIGKKYLNSYIKVRRAYGGVVPGEVNDLTGVENVEAMQKSNFTIVPPGNYSAQTFRLCEAIICNSIPLTKNFIASDPLYSASKNLNITLGKAKSWKVLLNQAQKLTEIERIELLGRLREELQASISISRLKVENLINS